MNSVCEVYEEIEPYKNTTVTIDMSPATTGHYLSVVASSNHELNSRKIVTDRQKHSLETGQAELGFADLSITPKFLVWQLLPLPHSI